MSRLKIEEAGSFFQRLDPSKFNSIQNQRTAHCTALYHRNRFPFEWKSGNVNTIFEEM